MSKSIFSARFFVLLLILITFLNLSRYRTAINPQWLAIQTWARESTEPECVFLVPFDTRGFRIGSMRPSIGDYKDGTLSFYSESFATEWNKRKKDLEDWLIFPEEKIIELSNRYKFDFVVTKTNNQKKLSIVYQNNDYIIYDTRSNSTCKSKL